MKIPQLHGRHKIRDTKICRDYVVENESVSTLAERFKISGSRVYRILYNNREFLKLDKEWEKTKRIHWLQKQLKTKTSSKKDGADIIDQLRREVEGDKITQEMKVVDYRRIEIVVTDDKATLLPPPKARRSLSR